MSLKHETCAEHVGKRDMSLKHETCAAHVGKPKRPSVPAWPSINARQLQYIQQGNYAGERLRVSID